MTKKFYLVTGGTGFIGQALVRRLLADGHRVRVLDNDSRGSKARLADVLDDIELHVADIRDSAAVCKAAAGVDSILHLAYINGTEFFYSRPEMVLDVGIRGMLSVVDACRANGIGEMVLASSSEVYQTPPLIPTPETVPLTVPDILNPRYSYGGGKIASELIAMNYGRTGFERVLVFRPHNVVGPDMGWEHVLPQFCLRLKRLCVEHPTGVIPFPLQGDGSETRAFIDVNDFIDGLMLMLAKGEHLNVYHIGTRAERTIADAARTVAAYFGREIEIVPGPLQPGGTLRRCPDITKLEALGFTPATPFAHTVRRLAAWYDANADKAPQK
ncbi:MAG: NAD-dependent epimerase/dehydratase family protein [Desulfovibrionaceae bacterium]